AGLDDYLHGAGAARVRREVGLDDYAALFVEARRAPRRIRLLLGPTNSGKTHAALDRLAEADNGVYLAPLRLLALEGAESIAARGRPCSMITGEERRLIDGARHLASTIEMLDVGRRV